MDRYFLVGHPVAHSLSPFIHREFARQTGIALDYTALEVQPGALAATISDLFQSGYLGGNVTVPFKGEACALVDELAPEARRAGAVNTLSLGRAATLAGFNTDGVGLVRALSNNPACTLSGCTVVLLGAGGAAAGVIEPLLAAGVRELIVSNRHPPRAEALVARFADRWRNICALPLAQLPPADLLVNATSAGLTGARPQVPQQVIMPTTFACDMMYGAQQTAFLCWCREQGAKEGADGLGMLVEQAAEAFFLWRGLRPETAPVLRSLRRHLQSCSNPEPS